MSQMPADVQKRIRALPGNNVCADCENVNPQWASVSYGCMLCLECSGHHRSLGVHLSFVRSVAMDSWTEKQIEAMEKSGGNAKLVEFFESKGIKKSMRIPTKYNTKQAQYYRDRLARWLEGRREPPPDPGNYNPETGVSDAQGAEPLPGETTEQYNARQAKLREEARERMRAKFGQGGMSGIGAGGAISYDGSGGGSGGFDDDSWGGKIGGAVSGLGGFLKEKVIDNDNLRSKVGGVASGVGGVAGGAYNSLRSSETFGGVTEKVGGVAGSLWGKVTGQNNNPSVSLQEGKTLAQQEKELWDSMYAKPTPAEVAAAVTSNQSAPNVAPPNNIMGGGSNSGSLGRTVSAPTPTHSPAVKKPLKKDDFKDVFDDWGDDWGESAKAAPAPSNLNRASTAPATATKLDDSTFDEPTPTAKSDNGAETKTNGSNGYSPEKPAEAKPVAEPASPPKELPKKPPVMETTPVVSPKKKSVELKSADDFFADFGM